MGLRDNFDQQVNSDLQKEAKAKPYIPQGSYNFKIKNWREDSYPETWKIYGGQPNVQATFLLYNDEGELVGRHNQDMTWVEGRDQYGNMANPSKVWYELMALSDTELVTLGQCASYLDSEPIGRCYGLESIQCKVGDLDLTEQDKAVSSGKGMDDTVYVNKPTDEQREALLDKGYTSKFTIRVITPTPDMF
jgi:hypothetical protein